MLTDSRRRRNHSERGEVGPAERLQENCQIRYPVHRGPIRRVSQYAQEPALGSRTCRPPGPAIVFEPVVRELVMDVIRIDQRYQEVDVEQRRTGHGVDCTFSRAGC